MASTSARGSRTQDGIFLVGYQAHQITGCKLPSKRQVLATLFFNLRTEKLNLRESARIAIQEVFVFWAKARIPTKHKQNAISKLEKLYAEWRTVQKNKNKQSDVVQNKLKAFASNLDDIFDIAHQDALTIMKSEEDKEFLIKQRQKGRPGSMIGLDLKLARAEERKLKKERTRLDKQIETERFDIGNFFCINSLVSLRLQLCIAYL